MPTSEVIKLSNVRLSFPVLFTPKSFSEGQLPRFESAFLLDPSDKNHAASIEELRQHAENLLLEHFGGEIPHDVKLSFGNADASPITLGKDYEWRGTKKTYDGYEGMFFITSSNRTRPTVVDRDRSPLAESDGKPYAGCFVNATITLWVQDNQYGKRINANLRAVQFVGDGEAFGVKPVDADDEFAILDGEDENFLS